MNCPKCGEPIGEDGEWPVDVDGQIKGCCLTCWESECDDGWWDAMAQLNAAGLLEESE